MTRFQRGIAIALLLAGAGLVAAWRAGVWLLERVPSTTDGATTPSCQSIRNPDFARAIDQATSQARALLAERRIPGLAVAVAVRGELVWSAGFGYADRDAGRPACGDTQFRLASVSKPVTTAAMARLIEARRLDLDASIHRYVPSFPDKESPITPRHLASHRAGIRHYRDDLESLNQTSYPTATASLERFSDDPLLFTPDTDFHYSSYGFVLLSAALEGATGRDFPTLLDEWVFTPLGMRSSSAERAGAAYPNLSAFYDHVTPYSTDGTIRPSPFIDHSMKWAGGGLISTVEDLVRFGSAHIVPHNEGFLSAETVELLFTPRSSTLGVFGYGLGWMAARDPRLRRVRFHFGAGSGATSVLALYPARGVTLALLSNLGHAGFSMRRLMRIAHPFVGDPLMPVALAAVAILLAAAAWLAWPAIRAESPLPRSS